MRSLRFSGFAAHTRCAVLAALCLVAASAGMSAARAEARVALVIGNNDYPTLGADHQLTKAVNDAQAVGDALEKDGFRVLRGSNLNRAQMVDKLSEMSALLQPGDTALFFFAGHGVALDGGNYLLPSDVPQAQIGQATRIANQSLAETDVIASLKERGARVVMLILDACRDNPFKQPGVRSVGLERGFARMPEASGVFSLYSAGFGQSALDRLSDQDTDPNSVFTRVLVPRLTRPGLNIDDLAYEVREAVASLAASTPDRHQQVPAAYDQIVGGRVYLAGAPAEPVATQSVVPRPDHGGGAPLGGAAGSSGTAPPPAGGRATPSSVSQSPATTAALGSSLGADQPIPDSVDEAGLVRATETELNRLGCDAGVPSDRWNSQARMALLRFAGKARLNLDVDRPDRKVLDMLRAQFGTVCTPSTPLPSATVGSPPSVSTPPIAASKPLAPVTRPRRRVATPRPAPARRAEPRSSVAVKPPTPVRRYAPRPASPEPTPVYASRPREAAPRASGCFVFNGQRVCE